MIVGRIEFAPQAHAHIAPMTDLEKSKLIEENIKLREALRLSTNGLRHCARWNISEETEKAIMTQVIANEELLTPNVKVRGRPLLGDPSSPPG